MPTCIPGRALTRSERLRLDTAPLLVVVALSLLFALAFCAAFAPRPMPGTAMAAIVQGGP